MKKVINCAAIVAATVVGMGIAQSSSALELSPAAANVSNVLHEANLTAFKASVELSNVQQQQQQQRRLTDESTMFSGSATGFNV